MPQFEWIDEIITRLDSGLGLSGNESKIIEFEQNQFLKGLEFISPIYNAILYKRVLEIEYNSFKATPKHIITLHPYFLKQYNNRWYIFGKNDSNGLINNLSLDRIVSITQSKKKYLINKSVDFNEYFDDLIGVSLMNNGKIQNVVLKVSNSLLPYILTKPLHGSQKIKSKHKDYAIITLDLIPNYELESLLLSYGEGIIIIEPKTLVNKINARIETMRANYKIKKSEK